jgi:hypothetical protein
VAPSALPQAGGVTFENGSGARPTASNVTFVDANTITVDVTVTANSLCNTLSCVIS